MLFRSLGKDDDFKAYINHQSKVRGGERGGHKGRENRRWLLGDGVKSLNISLEFGGNH